MMFVRENSEGEYADSGSWLYKGQAKEMVIQNSIFSREGCERVMRYAYDLARSKNKTLTSISKANALNYSMVFWDQIFKEIGKDYPDVKTTTYLVDAASMLMIKDPKRFQVVVASNLFGDILTDLGAAIAGGIGLAAGANLNPERKYPPMFEPIHGSANDIAGKGIANPLAAIWSISQMLDYLGYEKEGTLVLSCIEKVLKDAQVLTPDMGGNASTSQTGDEVVKQLDALYHH
ncbi:MAG: tartrate dehydrogenase/decarboxylase / D-malate dehydrogenase [Erysipelotrichaceae bacterium]|nr:MAG: tartrate dehydrogenase/decarboxylase / D-malate [Erysipelotrichaceae bacterium]TXT18608.1 MAG: tartrate dehydrogenase/decarboxylase / D-malate dehydrogenase [Erysipelotrichaceae bacterium]